MTTSSSISSGSTSSTSSGISSSDSGSRQMMPSSLHSTCTGRSRRASFSSIASAHGACTRAPNGVRMQTRQSPISSAKRSITIVRSSGTAPVASACSSRYARRFDDARCVEAARGEAQLCVVGLVAQLPHERAQRPPELERPAGLVALPERRLGGLARRRGDDDAVEGDLLDAPRRRAEHERLADPALVHHLLVELADARAVGEEHAEQPAVGDGAAARDRHVLRALAGTHAVLGAVPHDARPQAGELVGGVAAGEHVERLAEHVVGELGEVGAPPDHREQVVDVPLVERARRDDLLRDDVERVARVAHLLDEAVAHALHDDRGFEQVAAVLREDLARARLAHLVPGAADALEPAGHRTRRLDQHHEVDRAHVDAELEAAGGDDRRAGARP